MFSIDDDPTTFYDTITSQDDCIQKLVNDEMKSKMGIYTWIMSDLLLGCNTLLGCKTLCWNRIFKEIWNSMDQ